MDSSRLPVEKGGEGNIGWAQTVLAANEDRVEREYGRETMKEKDGHGAIVTLPRS